MKTITLLGLITSVAIWISGCGKEESRLQRTFQTSSCPLYFASENLCAEMTWVKGPSADVKSALTVAFWKKDAGSSSGPFVDPGSQVGAFLRMTCCGSISFPKVEKMEAGKFLVSEMGFTPGNWEVYVQLKQGENVEKQFVKVHIDD